MKHREKRPDRPEKPPSGGGGSYWLYGVHAVKSALANPNRRIKRLVATKNTAETLDKLPGKAQLEISDGKTMERYVGADSVHQGIAALVDPLEQPALEDLLFGEQTKPLVVLDQVTDPHNVGAILRSAAAFGAAAVIFPKDHAAKESATLAKAASGALDIVPLVEVTNLARTLEQIKQAGYWVAGLDGEATTDIKDAKLTGKTALVLGAEGKGLRRLTAENCDLLVKLPIHAQMESLNVSNAAAVALYVISQR
ncbi:MAG: 23S rRNA (guanosine(2251)-2'-O)-methyltransferase RlmB [Rickettsiales bacterium]